MEGSFSTDGAVPEALDKKRLDYSGFFIPLLLLIGAGILFVYSGPFGGSDFSVERRTADILDKPAEQAKERSSGKQASYQELVEMSKRFRGGRFRYNMSMALLGPTETVVPVAVSRSGGDYKTVMTSSLYGALTTTAAYFIRNRSITCVEGSDNEIKCFASSGSDFEPYRMVEKMLGMDGQYSPHTRFLGGERVGDRACSLFDVNVSSTAVQSLARVYSYSGYSYLPEANLSVRTCLDDQYGFASLVIVKTRSYSKLSGETIETPVFSMVLTGFEGTVSPEDVMLPDGMDFVVNSVDCVDYSVAVNVSSFGETPMRLAVNISDYNAGGYDYNTGRYSSGAYKTVDYRFAELPELDADSYLLGYNMSSRPVYPLVTVCSKKHCESTECRSVYYTSSTASLTGTVWGTDTYTDDSDLCNAAVHAGKISANSTDMTITFVIRPGREYYTGSLKNGISTLDWASWGGSFVFPDDGKDARDIGSCPSNVRQYRGEDDKRYTCNCKGALSGSLGESGYGSRCISPYIQDGGGCCLDSDGNGMCDYDTSSAASQTGTVWGTGTYTDDSSLCNAAIHAGRISTNSADKTITFEIRPSQESYSGSLKNGMSTQNWESWGGSFVFADDVKDARDIGSCPYSVQRYRGQNSRRYTCICNGTLSGSLERSGYGSRCVSPDIQDGGGCCLDSDSDGICDSKEATTNMTYADVGSVDLPKGKTLCDRMTDLKKDNCYNKLAEETKTPETCNLIQSRYMRESCKAAINAILGEDILECDNLPGQYTTMWCQRDAAINLKDEELCRRITESDYSKYSCIVEVAKTEKRENTCLLIPEGAYPSKQDCVRMVRESSNITKCAVTTGDLDSQSTSTEQCYSGYILDALDAGVCDGIRRDDRDWCLRTAAILVNDRLICQTIKDDHIKNRCFRQVAINLNDEKICDKMTGKSGVESPQSCRERLKSGGVVFCKPKDNDFTACLRKMFETKGEGEETN